MAIKLIANYSKRLGLPGYSSHQFSVSVETELLTTDNIATESERLYQRLQSTVDAQMLQTGFVPPGDYGMDPAPGNGSAPSQPDNVTSVPQWQGPAWKCSQKQQELILKLVTEHSLDRNEVDHLARQRFGKGVKQLNKIEASGLIDELLETHGGRPQANGQRGSAGRNAYKGNPGRATA